MRALPTLKFGLAVAVGLLLVKSQAIACSTCYGASDSAMAEAMNWGIFTLLGVVAFVLGGVATFAIYLIKRSAMVAGEGFSAAVSETTTKI